MNIKHEETLLIYDCELLFQAQDQQGQTYMVSHIAKCHGECEYIAVPVNQKSLSQYKAGRIDLRQLMLAEGRGGLVLRKSHRKPRRTDLGTPGSLALRIGRTAHEGVPSRPQVQQERSTLTKRGISPWSTHTGFSPTSLHTS